MLIIIILFIFLFIIVSFKEYFRYRLRLVHRLPANDCYFQCAEGSPFAFGICIKLKRCEKLSGMIN